MKKSIKCMELKNLVKEYIIEAYYYKDDEKVGKNVDFSRSAYRKVGALLINYYQVSVKTLYAMDEVIDEFYIQDEHTSDTITKYILFKFFKDRVKEEDYRIILNPYPVENARVIR